VNSFNEISNASGDAGGRKSMLGQRRSFTDWRNSFHDAGAPPGVSSLSFVGLSRLDSATALTENEDRDFRQKCGGYATCSAGNN